MFAKGLYSRFCFSKNILFTLNAGDAMKNDWVWCIYLKHKQLKDKQALPLLPDQEINKTWLDLWKQISYVPGK